MSLICRYSEKLGRLLCAKIFYTARQSASNGVIFFLGWKAPIVFNVFSLKNKDHMCCKTLRRSHSMQSDWSRATDTLLVLLPHSIYPSPHILQVRSLQRFLCTKPQNSLEMNKTSWNRTRSLSEWSDNVEKVRLRMLIFDLTGLTGGAEFPQHIAEVSTPFLFYIIVLCWKIKLQAILKVSCNRKTC